MAPQCRGDRRQAFFRESRSQLRAGFQASHACLATLCWQLMPCQSLAGHHIVWGRFVAASSKVIPNRVAWNCESVHCMAWVPWELIFFSFIPLNNCFAQISFYGKCSWNVYTQNEYSYNFITITFSYSIYFFIHFFSFEVRTKFWVCLFFASTIYVNIERLVVEKGTKLSTLNALCLMVNYYF